MSLRVIDDRQGTDTETKTVTVTGRGPTAAFTASPNPVTVGQSVAFDGAGSTRPGRHDRQVRVGPRRQRQLRDRHRHDQDRVEELHRDRRREREAARHRRRGEHRRDHADRDRGGGQPGAARVLHGLPRSGGRGSDGDLRRDGIERPGRHDRQVRVGPRRQRQLRDRHGHHEDRVEVVRRGGKRQREAARDRQRRADRAGHQDGIHKRGAGRQQLRRSRAGHLGAVALLAHGRAHRWHARRQRGRQPRDDRRRRRASEHRAGSRATRTRPSASTAPTTPRSRDSTCRGPTRVTLEFWLKWDGYADDDDLAFEFTPNFNAEAGGFLVDPNSPQDGGRFGVAIGSGLSRNNAFFTRPSAGAWHHYALVLDAGAPGASQITPYVDGQAVSYFKGASGTGAGNFSNSQLFFMSRNASAPVRRGRPGRGRALQPRAHPGARSPHTSRPAPTPPPTASFTASPNPVNTGQTVSFDGTASSDTDGTVARYEWDLDGNGSYETDTGTTRTASRAYTQTGAVTVGLRVTDNDGDTASTTRSLTVTPGAGGVLHRNARHGADRPGRRVRRGRLHRRRRDDRQVRVGPRRQRQLRDRHRNDQDDQPHLRGRRDPERRAAGDRQRRQHRRGDPRFDYHQPPAQRFVHGHAYRSPDAPDRELQRRRLERSGRHAGSIRVGSRRQRQLRDGHRYHRDHDAGLHHARHRHRRAAGDRQQRRHRDRHAGRDRAERLCAAGPRHRGTARLLAAGGHRHDRR